MVQALRDVLADAPHLLAMRHRVNRVAGAGRDEVHHVEALLRHNFLHVNVRLEEYILVADSGDSGHDARVRCVINRVEHVQAALLMRRQRANPDEAGNRRLGEAMRVHVAAVRPERDEAARVLQPQMPRARRAHAHAAKHDAVAVNAVVAAHGLDGLEHVRLARPAVAVLHATQRMQLDEVHVRRGFRGVISLVEARAETQFAHAHGLRAAV